MKVHQVIVATEQDTVLHRDLSCFCYSDCEHFTTLKSKLTTSKLSSTRASRSNHDRDKSLGTNQIVPELKSSKKKENTETKQTRASKRRKFERENTTATDESTCMPLDYRRCLHDLGSCESFKKVQDECKKVEKRIEDIDTYPHVTHILSDGIEIDEDVVQCMSTDLNTNIDLLPCHVNSDGNCLPSTGSTFAFGNKDQVHEIRLRIVLELVKHEKYYLNDSFLESGTYSQKSTEQTSLKKQYAQYSEYFIPGCKLSDVKIRTIYRKEIESVIKDKTYMGIWQIHALASVLKTPIFSCYSCLGNLNIRRNLHRLVKPVEECRDEPTYCGVHTENI